MQTEIAENNAISAEAMTTDNAPGTEVKDEGDYKDPESDSFFNYVFSNSNLSALEQEEMRRQEEEQKTKAACEEFLSGSNQDGKVERPDIRAMDATNPPSCSDQEASAVVKMANVFLQSDLKGFRFNAGASGPEFDVCYSLGDYNVEYMVVRQVDEPDDEEPPHISVDQDLSKQKLDPDVVTMAEWLRKYPEMETSFMSGINALLQTGKTAPVNQAPDTESYGHEPDTEKVPDVADVGNGSEFPEKKKPAPSVSDEEVEEASPDTFKKLRKDMSVEDIIETIRENGANAAGGVDNVGFYLNFVEISKSEYEADEVDVSSENGQASKFFDDGMPGIVVFINGKQVSKETFMQFIEENKEEFVDAYNNAYLKELERLGKTRETFEHGGKASVPPSRRKSFPGTNIDRSQETAGGSDQEPAKPKYARTPSEWKNGDPDKGKEVVNRVLRQFSGSHWHCASFSSDGYVFELERTTGPGGQYNWHPNYKFSKDGGACQDLHYKDFYRYAALHEEELTNKLTAALEEELGSAKNRQETAKDTGNRGDGDSR